MASAAQQLIEEGIARGKVLAAETLAGSVLEVLSVRGIAMSSADHERVLGTKDPEMLSRWLRRALTASSFDEVVRDT